MITKSHYNKCFKIYKKLLMKQNTVLTGPFKSHTHIALILMPILILNTQKLAVRKALLSSSSLPFIAILLLSLSLSRLQKSLLFSCSPFSTPDVHRIAKQTKTKTGAKMNSCRSEKKLLCFEIPIKRPRTRQILPTNQT